MCWIFLPHYKQYSVLIKSQMILSCISNKQSTLHMKAYWIKGNERMFSFHHVFFIQAEWLNNLKHAVACIINGKYMCSESYFKQILWKEY